ncbi:MAG: response regulator [Oligoflexia bacterium]|nr:response regulator [Oligoflexia bacterium]
MPDLLVHARTHVEGAQIEALAEKHGFRVKFSADTQIVTDWLRTRGFDVLLVHGQVPINVQQDFAGRLWEKNAGAHFLVYDLSENSRINKHEVKLFGAELFKGPQALEQLDKFLGDLHPIAPPSQDDFQVMVVEDLDSPRDIICFFLEGMGYAHVKGEPSAKSAMQVLEQDPRAFSCVITDIRMPEISGKELIEQIRKHDKLKHLPVIVLTAHGTADCLIDCLKAGASGFLVKPPKKQDLTRELARAVRISAGQSSPRLVTPDDAEYIRGVLADRGLL